jgi:hypothetical protein
MRHLINEYTGSCVVGFFFVLALVEDRRNRIQNSSRSRDTSYIIAEGKQERWNINSEKFTNLVAGR